MTTTDPSALPPDNRARLMKRVFWLGILWLEGWLGMILAGALGNSDALTGMKMQAFIGAFISPVMLIASIPLGLLGWWIGAVKILRPWRWWISLLLPGLLAFADAGQAARDRFQPERRITRLTRVKFPEPATILRQEFRSGAFIDLHRDYEFTCSAEETDRFIRELGLEETKRFGSMPPGGKAGPAWTVDSVWRGRDVGWADFVELETDATRTKVRLICGTL